MLADANHGIFASKKTKDRAGVRPIGIGVGNRFIGSRGGDYDAAMVAR